ncbi:MAG: hypothetical protein QXJ64_08810 [Thermosphaera sp.]
MNDECINVIKIDIDIPYDMFMDWAPFYESVADYVLIKLARARIKQVRYYRSEHGNVHVYIDVDKCVPKDAYHIVQFFLYNDHKRTMLNYTRYKRFGDHYDFLFP